MTTFSAVDQNERLSRWLRGAFSLRVDTRLKVSFVALSWLDLVLTIHGVGHGFVELNPVMASMMHRPADLALFKGAAPLAAAWVSPAIAIVPCVLLLAAVIGWDLGMLLGAF